MCVRAGKKNKHGRMKDKNERIRKIKIRDKKTRQRKTLRGEKVEICSHTQERRRRRRKRARKVEEGREEM